MFLAVSLASVLWLGTAAAEPAPSASAAKPAAKTSSAQGSGKKKIIRLDAITVEGRIQKPQAFYILQRSNLNFEELNRSESFIPKVIRSVEKDPF
jgi:hypothetical protein